MLSNHFRHSINQNLYIKFVLCLNSICERLGILRELYCKSMAGVGSGYPLTGPEPGAGILKSTAQQIIRDWMHRGYKNASSSHLVRTMQKVVSLGTLFCKN
jgi:hypothetical protein